MMLRFIVTSIFLFFTMTVNAAVVTPGSYQFFDHPDSALFVSGQTGPYGLRLDTLFNPFSKGPTFSVNQNGANVLLNWDGGATATITGQVWNNANGGLWTVSHVLSDITITSQGFLADTGLLTLTDPSSNVLEFDSKSNGIAAFLALGDNHRCGSDADCGPLTARGWLEPDINVAGQSNDWLVQLVAVPIPAAIWLFATTLIGLGSTSVRRPVALV